MPTVAPRKVAAVMDTDTFNEIDDQFALAYMMLAREHFSVRAVLAAPFHNERSTGPADGMEKSYEEILRVFGLLGEDPAERVFRGSTAYLPDRRTPAESEAAARLVELARPFRGGGEKLHVLAIAAVTNVASALLMDPSIADALRIVWLGGHAYTHADNDEFNLRQDVAAAQVVFDSGASLTHIPCAGVASALWTSVPELAAKCRPLGPLGGFLFERTRDYMLAGRMATKVIWDIATVACHTIPEALETATLPAPRLLDDKSWKPAPGRHEIQCITRIDRDRVFDDLYRRLRAFAEAETETVVSAQAWKE